MIVLYFGERKVHSVMTDDEKKNRALAVETLYQIYKKYYPRWLCEKEYRADYKEKEDVSYHSNKK